MEITEVKINLIANQEPVKAWVTITVDNCFRINDLRIIKTETKTFLAMPSRKVKDPNRYNQTYKDIVHPINAEARKYIEETVLKEYEKALQSLTNS